MSTILPLAQWGTQEGRAFLSVRRHRTLDGLLNKANTSPLPSSLFIPPSSRSRSPAPLPRPLHQATEPPVLQHASNNNIPCASSDPSASPPTKQELQTLKLAPTKPKESVVSNQRIRDIAPLLYHFVIINNHCCCQKFLYARAMDIPVQKRMQNHQVQHRDRTSDFRIFV